MQSQEYLPDVIVKPREHMTNPYTKKAIFVECFFNRIKWYRIFSPFEKLAAHYFGILSFVSALIWLH